MMSALHHVLPVVAFLVGTLAPGVAAQATSDATCTLRSYNWAFNSLNQSPCLIVAYAQAACTGGSFNVPSIGNSSYYIGPKSPSQANPCTCSTPVWSLISACGACQNATYITPWNDWATNCSTVYTTYPEDIPAGTSIPAWAYLDLPKDGIWDPVAAKADSNAPESTASHASTASSLPSSASSIGQSATLSNSASASVVISTVTRSTPTPTNTSGSSSGGSGSNTGAIAGGVVGGIAALAIIGGLLFWCIRKRRNSSAQPAYTAAPPSDQDPSTMGQSPTSAGPVSSYSAPYTMGSTAEQRLYDPNDPSTFPRTPASANYSNVPSQQSPFYQSAVNPYQTPLSTPGAGQPLTPNRGYHGVAEV